MRDYITKDLLTYTKVLETLVSAQYKDYKIVSLVPDTVKEINKLSDKEQNDIKTIVICIAKVKIENNWHVIGKFSIIDGQKYVTMDKDVVVHRTQEYAQGVIKIDSPKFISRLAFNLSFIKIQDIIEQLLKYSKQLSEEKHNEIIS